MRQIMSFAILAGVCALALESRGSILYSTALSTYSQNFDTLPTTPENASLGASPAGWTDDNAAPAAGNFSIVGAYLYHPTAQSEGGFNGKQRMRIGAGTANTGAFMSFGASTSTERAFGSLASNTTAAVVDGGVQYMAMRLTNNTGVTLGSFTLSYDGEQWRDGGNATPVAQSLIFGYKTTNGAANVQDPGFNPEPLLNFTSPVFTNTGSGAAVNGNTAGKVAIGPVTVHVIWAPGDDLWIRWADANDSGNDHGLAVDNLSFSADPVPEPSSLMLLVAAAFGLALAKRRSAG
jgi:hypothetical protein